MNGNLVDPRIRMDLFGSNPLPTDPLMIYLHLKAAKPLQIIGGFISKP
jgi:hypothetical protein